MLSCEIVLLVVRALSIPFCFGNLIYRLYIVKFVVGRSNLN